MLCVRIKHLAATFYHILTEKKEREKERASSNNFSEKDNRTVLVFHIHTFCLLINWCHEGQAYCPTWGILLWMECSLKTKPIKRF